MSGERNRGLDLLKILAMLGVMLLHILGHGGALETAQDASRPVLTALKVLSVGAVDCFVLITGFTMRHVRFARLAELWLRVLLYSAGIALVFFLAGRIRAGELAAAFFPIASNQYWFFSCYAGLCLLIPLLNTVGHRRLILFTAALVSLLSLPDKNVMGLNNGYSLAWFVMLYLIGGSVRECRLRSRLLLVIAAGCMLLSWAVTVLTGCGVLTEYMSPTVLVPSVCLVVVFSRLPVKGRLIPLVTPLIFSAYLLQDNPWIRKQIITGRFAGQTSPLIVIAAGLACLVAGCAADIPREWLFRKLRVRDRLGWADRLIQGEIKDV